MLILEVFLSPRCLSAPTAIALAEQAIQYLGQFRLHVHDEMQYEQKMKALGIFMTPAFVIGTDIIAIGTPHFDQLVTCLKAKLKDSR